MQTQRASKNNVDQVGNWSPGYPLPRFLQVRNLKGLRRTNLQVFILKVVRAPELRLKTGKTRCCLRSEDSKGVRCFLNDLDSTTGLLRLSGEVPPKASIPHGNRLSTKKEIKSGIRSNPRPGCVQNASVVSGLDRQLGQIVVADLYVLKRRLGFVIFHEIMLDSRFVRLGKDALPINLALADVGHMTGLFGGAGRAAVVAAAGTL